MRFIQDLRERHVARYLVTYGGVGWLVLEAVDQVVDRSVLPEIVYRVFLTLFLCGLPGALIVSWFHGAKGRQTVPPLERWLLVGVGLFALTTTGWVARTAIMPAEGQGAAIPPEQDPSRVAVLYFDGRGGGGDVELLASGLTEGLIDELSPVSALTVVSRNGSELFRDSSAPPASIGRTLEVGTLVDGVVTEADGEVRVTVNMIDATTGKQLETTRITRPKEDLFALQDSLVRRVSVFLRQKIGAEVGELTVRSGTRVVEAWKLLQRAEKLEDNADEVLARGDVEGASETLLGADSVLASARAADPRWTEPLVRRAWLAYRQSRLGGMDRGHYERWLSVGMAYADSALAETPKDPDALEVRATLQYWRYLLNLAGDPQQSDRLFQEAEKGFREAIAINPQQASAMTSLSHLLLNKGDVAGAKLMAEESYEADPFLENVNLTLWRLVSTSFELGDEVELRRHCREGRTRFPDFHRFSQCRLMVFAMFGSTDDIPEAWTDLETFVEQTPRQLQQLGRKQGLMYIAMGLARLSKEDTGRPALADSARAVARRGRGSPDEDPLRNLAQLEAIVRTWLGDYNEAVRLLGTYMAANPGTLDAYRSSVTDGTLPWYLQDLADQPDFRDLLGLE